MWKKKDQKIQPKNSGHSLPRIRPQIRVSEVQNPLCRNLSLRRRLMQFSENLFPEQCVYVTEM